MTQQAQGRAGQWCARHPYLSLAIAAALLPLPLMFYITPDLDSGDMLFYRIVMSLFSQQFWQGDLYPRWLLAANDGTGSPAMLFIGPAAYFAAALFEPLAAFDGQGAIRFTLAIIFARLLMGWLAYRLFLKHLPPGEALLGALLLLLLPYNVHEIYVRGELAVQWAIVFLLASLLATHKMQANLALGLAELAASLALLVLAHLPSYVVFCWIPFVYALYFPGARSRACMGWLVVLGGVFSALLSMFYILPLFANKPYINAGYYFSGRYHFSENFLIHPNEFFCIPYFVLAALSWWALRGRMQQPGEKHLLRFCLCCVLVVGFMVLPLSQPLWQLLFPLHYVQFPHRFLNGILFVFALLAALLFARNRLRPLICMIWGIGLSIHFYVIVMFSPYDMNGILAKVMDKKIITLEEYIVRWQPPRADAMRLLLKDELPAELASVTNGATVSAPAPGPVLRFTLDAPAATELTLRRLYYPGATVRDVKTGTLYAPGPNGQAMQQLALPKGKYELEAYYAPAPGQSTGNLISWAAFGMTALLAAYGKRKRA